jgi:predicted acyl esterase
MLAVSSGGTEDSGGQLDPFRQERADTQAVLEWLSKQDWFSGELVTTGASYFGFTAWAYTTASG